MIQNNQIQEWWNEYFPDETLNSVETPSGGATTQTFILNRNKLLKVYISKDGSEIKDTFYKNASLAMEVLENSDFFLRGFCVNLQKAKCLRLHLFALNSQNLQIFPIFCTN
jgi:hypothetical protein